MVTRWMAVMLVLGMTVGCKSNPAFQDPASRIQEAKQLMEQGELYRARKMVSAVLEENPATPRAEELMSEIIAREVARQKDVLDSSAPQLEKQQEQQDQVRTWLERSRMLLNLGEFDAAAEAAEKVFVYDPQNVEASRLLDEVTQQAIKAKKSGDQILKAVSEDEIKTRLAKYRADVRRQMEKGEIGGAQISIEKILLLSPDDSEALKLKKEIANREQATAKQK